MSNPWCEAMRPRTLPVSIAGVLAGCSVAIIMHSFQWLPALLCLVFALLAQIASNFANEYFDFKNGLDKKGRDGFRRGVTEGDISPRAMLSATLITLAAAGLAGVSLMLWGGWQLLPVGIVIACFALAYSAGPYPLSHHGLGDIAVFIFFGIIPVTLTAWLQAPSPDTVLNALPIAAGVGLLSVNVLIVNNYRDADDDRAVNKRTTVVIFGRKTMSTIYLVDVIIGTLLIWINGAILAASAISNNIGLLLMLIIPVLVIPGVKIHHTMTSSVGSQLNLVLKNTAQLLLLNILLLIAAMTLFAIV